MFFPAVDVSLQAASLCLPFHLRMERCVQVCAVAFLFLSFCTLVQPGAGQHLSAVPFPAAAPSIAAAPGKADAIANGPVSAPTLPRVGNNAFSGVPTYSTTDSGQHQPWLATLAASGPAIAPAPPPDMQASPVANSTSSSVPSYSTVSLGQDRPPLAVHASLALTAGFGMGALTRFQLLLLQRLYITQATERDSSSASWYRLAGDALARGGVSGCAAATP